MPVRTTFRERGGPFRSYHSTYQALSAPTQHVYVFQLDEADAVDALISSDAPTTNFATGATFGAGENNVSVVTQRTMIKPPLSSLPPFLTSFNAVYLDLQINLDRSSTARDFKFYRVLRNWVENQVTWNEWSTGNAWTTAGCGSAGNDYNNTALATLNLTSTETVGAIKRWSFNTSILYQMYSGALPNYGLLFRVDDGVTELNDEWIFNSSNAASGLFKPRWTFDVEGVFKG